MTGAGASGAGVAGDPRWGGVAGVGGAAGDGAGAAAGAGRGAMGTNSPGFQVWGMLRMAGSLRKRSA